jgi:hypothetical protein
MSFLLQVKNGFPNNDDLFLSYKKQQDESIFIFHNDFVDFQYLYI